TFVYIRAACARRHFAALSFVDRGRMARAGLRRPEGRRRHHDAGSLEEATTVRAIAARHGRIHEVALPRSSVLSFDHSTQAGSLSPSGGAATLNALTAPR